MGGLLAELTGETLELIVIQRLVVKKGHIEEARYLCDKKNKDVQQRRLGEVLLRLPDRMDAAWDVNLCILFTEQRSVQDT